MNVVFEREGEYWSVGQGRATSRLRDSKGLRYIDLLLRKPEVEFHAVDLVTAVEGSSPEPRIQAHQSKQGTAIDALAIGAEDAGELLDPEARRAYKERLDDLRGEIEEAEAFNDPERVASATEEAECASRANGNPEASAAVAPPHAVGSISRASGCWAAIALSRSSISSGARSANWCTRRRSAPIAVRARQSSAERAPIRASAPVASIPMPRRRATSPRSTTTAT